MAQLRHGSQRQEINIRSYCEVMACEDGDGVSGKGLGECLGIGGLEGCKIVGYQMLCITRRQCAAMAIRIL